MHQIYKRHHPLILTAGRILLERRWLVLVIGFSTVFIVETVAHWPITRYTLELHFVFAIALYGIVGPVIIWGLLTMLASALAIDLPVQQIQAEATQAERQRIARDLHDKLAQNLGYLHFKLDHLATPADTTLIDIELIQTDLEKMRRIANDAYKQVRGTLDTLRSAPNVMPDLVFTLRQQAQVVSGNTGLNITIDCNNNTTVCPLIKRTMAEITQEALANISKHAHADKVTVAVTCNRADACLTITDNGKGFEMNKLPATLGHYGLAIMRERAEETGGNLAIESTPNKGTQLTARFPNAVISKSLLHQCQNFNCEHPAGCPQ